MTAPAPVQRLLDAAIDETRRLGRDDLSRRLETERTQLTAGPWHVLVAGEFKKGKSALVNALLNLSVCGSDAVAYTAVPTIVKYGAEATASLRLDTTDDPFRRPRAVDLREAGKYALRGVDDDGTRLDAVEVTLPRGLLRSGLVLVDSPGLGGGFAAAQAAATMRAMSLANAVVVVTDASQELTAAEVEFLQHAAKVCPDLLCVLTKTDFYPEWRRILDIDREHLRRAGLDIDVVPTSSTLRTLAIETGDPALNNESGFPVLVDRLRSRIAARRARTVDTHAAVVRNSLSQVASALDTEQTVLERPEERPATVARLDDAERRVERLKAPSARWQHVINDRFADIRSRLDADLHARIKRLEDEANRRIKAGDPTDEWAEITPWLYRRTNEELTDCHQKLLAQIDAIAREVGDLFDDEAVGVRTVTGGYVPAAGEAYKLDRLNTRGSGKLEAGMHAARGWSLSSSVVTTVLIATLHPGLLVVLPITAALGSVFAIKAVRSFRTSRIEVARNEGLRAVASYLNQARMDAGRASADILRHSHAQLRDYYFERAEELMATVQQGRMAAMQAGGDGQQARTDLARVNTLITVADKILAKDTR
jgi:hypothetical protein